VQYNYSGDKYLYGGLNMLHSPEEINKLVEDYKNNTDTNSLEKLVTIFNPFIQKWVNIVKYGSINILDKDSVKFISLFGCSSFMEFTDNIVRNLYYMTEDDIYNEFIILFIYTINKYVFNGIYFPGYLVNSYMYRVYRWVMNEIKNSTILTSNLPQQQATKYDEDPSEVVFHCLTLKEQNILTSIYVNDLTKNEVAKRNNITIVRLNKIIANAKTKILKEINSYYESL